jgi:hypothetical protein
VTIIFDAKVDNTTSKVILPILRTHTLYSRDGHHIGVYIEAVDEVIDRYNELRKREERDRVDVVP